ncbi:hypothetical protein ACFSUK_12160 [Sphingobium scionense]
MKLVGQAGIMLYPDQGNAGSDDMGRARWNEEEVAGLNRAPIHGVLQNAVLGCASQ